MKKVELLAPAGNFDALVAAINNGADAVYLATERFGARSFAKNFSFEELEQAVKLAHLNEVKVYVTMNTLIYEDEIEDAMKTVDILYNLDVDALLIQDLGLLELISNMYPDFELHASTQMHIHNVESCKFIMKHGIKRVVLARETPIEVVREICKLPIEVEIFVYGALCVSYSGQCLMSSILKSRSGNRGSCAQLCRLPYVLYDIDKDNSITDNQYLISPKDLNTIDYINELIEAGVSSLKIEGRMKRSEYVGEVVHLYREKIDNYYASKDYKMHDDELESLEKLFNRGFTKGYLFNETNKNIVNKFRPNHLGIQIGILEKVSNESIYIRLSKPLHQHDGIRIINDYEDVGLVCNYLYRDGLLVNKGEVNDLIEMKVTNKLKVNDIVVLTSDSKQLEAINQSNKQVHYRVPLDIQVNLFINQPLSIIVNDHIGNKYEFVDDFIVAKALKQAISKERIIDAIDKIKDTNFYFNSININMDDEIFVPIKILNEARRNVIDGISKLKMINHKRNGKCEYRKPKLDINCTNYIFKEICDLNQYHDDGSIYVTNNYDLVNDNIKFKACSVNEKDKYHQAMVISQLGDLNHLNGYTLAFASLNVTNSYALAFLYKNHVDNVMLSLEMNDYQIDLLIDSFKARYNIMPNICQFVYGCRDLMTMKYCPLNATLSDGTKQNCSLCRKHRYYLKTSNNELLPLLGDYHCNMSILEEKAYSCDKHPKITNYYYRYTIEK